MPTGNLTLIDVAKQMKESPERGIILTYATSYHPLAMMPFPIKAGGVIKWNMINDLAYSDSASAYRNLYAEPTVTKTPTQKFTANVKITSGRVQGDRVLDELSPGDKAIQRIGQVQAHARQITIDIFEGAGGTAINGLNDYFDNVELFENQTVNCGTASAGAVLSVDKLDELYSAHANVRGQTFLYMNDAPARRVRKLARGTGTFASGSYEYNINYLPSQFGFFDGHYDGVPIVPLRDGKGVDLLSNTEGDGASTTVYMVTYGDDMLTGFQSGPMKVIPGKDKTVIDAFDIEHLINIAPKSMRCISRLRYVKNAVS